MKIVRFAVDSKVSYGILKGRSVQEIEGTPFQHQKTIGERYRLKEVKLLPPCNPSKIVALGLNYHSYIEEVGSEIPEYPPIFLEPSTALIGSEDNIIFPSSSSRIDYEAELAVVIKKPVWRVPLEEALDYVLGYTCFNDITIRDIHNRDMQWTRSKDFDTFAAIGPCIETELEPDNVFVESFLNGEQKQKGNTSDLVFSVMELIHYISHVLTLLPGDIIATGTPSGTGPMESGDTIDIKVEPIGTLRNYVATDGS